MRSDKMIREEKTNPDGSVSGYEGWGWGDKPKEIFRTTSTWWRCSTAQEDAAKAAMRKRKQDEINVQ